MPFARRGAGRSGAPTALFATLPLVPAPTSLASLPRGVVHVFRWDLDKTYLRTNFDTFVDLMRTAIERPEHKRTSCRAQPALMRELRAIGPVAITFVSGSPTQMRESLEAKLRLDGVQWDEFVLKRTSATCCASACARSANRSVTSYRRCSRRALRAPGVAPETLLRRRRRGRRAGLLAVRRHPGRAPRRRHAQAQAVLEKAGAYPDAIAQTCMRFARTIERVIQCGRIFIHLDRKSDPAFFVRYGPRVVPIYNYFQAALVLVRDGVLSPMRAAVRHAAGLTVEHDFVVRDLDRPRTTSRSAVTSRQTRSARSPTPRRRHPSRFRYPARQRARGRAARCSGPGGRADANGGHRLHGRAGGRPRAVGSRETARAATRATDLTKTSCRLGCARPLDQMPAPTRVRTCTAHAARVALTALALGAAAGCGARRRGSKRHDVADVNDVAIETGVDATPDSLCLEPLPDGSHATLNVDLSTNAQVAVADVLFVIDRTGSMTDEIANVRDGLRSIIVPGLVHEIPDLHLGLVTFADFPTGMYGQMFPPDVPFTLDRALDDQFTALQGAITNIVVGSGGDNPEAHVEAVYGCDGRGLTHWIPPAGGCPSSVSATRASVRAPSP